MKKFWFRNNWYFGRTYSKIIIFEFSYYRSNGMNALCIQLFNFELQFNFKLL
jgi:hypothetical protein